MQRRDINAADAPAPAGQYTQAVEVTGAAARSTSAGRSASLLMAASQKTPRRSARWLGAICRRNCVPPAWRSKIW